MKAITLTQPWAQLVAIGAKRIETRSWNTSYRGPLAIHAAKGLGPIGGKKGYQKLCATEPFYSVLQDYGKAYAKVPRELKELVENPLMPMGYVIAVAKLAHILPVDNVCISDQERAFGDYSPGRFAWFLDNVLKLRRPIPMKGALGLWECQI